MRNHPTLGSCAMETLTGARRLFARWGSWLSHTAALRALGTLVSCLFSETGNPPGHEPGQARFESRPATVGATPTDKNRRRREQTTTTPQSGLLLPCNSDISCHRRTCIGYPAPPSSNQFATERSQLDERDLPRPHNMAGRP